MEIQNADAIIKNRKEIHGIFPDAFFDVLLRANPEVFLEVTNMAKSNMTFEEVFTKAGIIPQWIEKGKEKTAQNLLARGMPIEEIAQVTELSIEKVCDLSSKKV